MYSMHNIINKFLLSIGIQLTLVTWIFGSLNHLPLHELNKNQFPIDLLYKFTQINFDIVSCTGVY